MDRTNWKESISSFGWLCARCQRGHLRKQDGEWSEQISADSRESREHEAWEPDWDDHCFGGLLRCDNPDCADPVAVSGYAKYDHFQVDFNKYETTISYRIKSVFPPPAPFPIPPSVPNDVREKLLSAAGLLWADHDAAGNKIRQSIESLLDERKVKKYPRTGPRKPISLHNRIVDYSATNSHAADALLAIKWIGNAGSHDGGLSRENILDAFDLMEVALEEVYVGHRKSLLQKLKKINTTKKPLRQKPARSRW